MSTQPQGSMRQDIAAGAVATDAGRPGLPPFLEPYDDAGLLQAQQRLQHLIDTGVPFEMPEAEVRALGEQSSMLLLDAKGAMRARGIEQADFPAMFNSLLRQFDAMKADKAIEPPLI